ncbi:hypothetical protein ACFLTH_12585 [Bacteroidota bacterium]
MNVIIIASICILVLIIIVVLVGRSGSNFSESTKCVAKGGVCTTEIKCNEGIGQNGVLCSDETNDVCCNPINIKT